MSYYASNPLMADWQADDAAAALAAHERADSEAGDLIRTLPNTPERKALGDQAYADFLAHGEILEATYEWFDRLKANSFVRAA